MRHVGTLTFAGTPYEVVEGSAREFSQLEDAYGFWDEENQRLLILEGQGPSRFRRTTNHEALHAIIGEAGAGCFFAGDDDEERKESQERFIRVVEPHLGVLPDLLAIGGRHA